MGSRYQTSTSAIMLLVVVIALEMVMFQGAWEIVLIPSITMVFLAFNLGLFFLLVRPRSLKTRIIGMIWGGIAACFAMGGYFWLGNSPPEMLGPLGRLMEGASKSWATSLPHQQGGLATILRLLSNQASWFESAVLDLLGVAVIWAGGWFQNGLHRRRARARASGRTGLPPLDDRAASPV